MHHKKFLPIVLSLLILQGITPVQPQMPVQSQILSSGADPSIVFVNQSITFRAVIQLAGDDILENVTLMIEDENTTAYYTLDQIEEEYSNALSFTQSGERSFQIFLYIQGEVEPVDSTIPGSFIVISNLNNIVPVEIPLNGSINIPAGHIMVQTPNKSVKLEVQTNRPLQVNLSSQVRDDVMVSTDSLPISDLFDITINNSAALDSAHLSVQYNQQVIDELDIQEELLQLRTRENSSQPWQIVPATVNSINNTVQAEVEHFSEWVVTAATPKLRFVNITETVELTSDMEYDLTAFTKNQGSYDANNVTIRLVSPSTVFIDNITITTIIDFISPLEVVPVTWHIIFEDPGEYNFIIYAESDNVDGDIMEIKFIVNPFDDGSPISDSAQRQETPYLIHTLSITIMLVVSLKRYRGYLRDEA